MRGDGKAEHADAKNKSVHRANQPSRAVEQYRTAGVAVKSACWQSAPAIKNKQARLVVRPESELNYDENKIFNRYRGHWGRNHAFNRERWPDQH
jgi:hypothetical protein